MRKVSDDPSRVVHNPVWLRGHVIRCDVCNLLTQEVEAITKTVKDRTYCHSTHTLMTP